MQADQFDLRGLASRIRNGDEAAAVQFFRELQRQLIRIARRYVRSGSSDSNRMSRTRSAIEQVLRGHLVNQHQSLEEAIRPLCLAALEAIRSERHALDTVCDR